MPGHSRIGIGVQSDKGYVKVASVLPDGPAARILSVDDIILAVNGKPVANTGMCTEDDACAVQKQIVFARRSSNNAQFAFGVERCVA